MIFSEENQENNTQLISSTYDLLNNIGLCVYACVYTMNRILQLEYFFFFMRSKLCLVVTKDLGGKLVKSNSLTIISMYVYHTLCYVRARER